MSAIGVMSRPVANTEWPRPRPPVGGRWTSRITAATPPNTQTPSRTAARFTPRMPRAQASRRSTRGAGLLSSTQRPPGQQAGAADAEDDHLPGAPSPRPRPGRSRAARRPGPRRAAGRRAGPPRRRPTPAPPAGTRRQTQHCADGRHQEGEREGRPVVEQLHAQPHDRVPEPDAHRDAGREHPQGAVEPRPGEPLAGDARRSAGPSRSRSPAGPGRRAGRGTSAPAAPTSPPADTVSRAPISDCRDASRPSEIRDSDRGGDDAHQQRDDQRPLGRRDETCRCVETSSTIGLPRPATTEPVSAAKARQAMRPRWSGRASTACGHASSNRVALAIPPPSHMVCSP